MRLARSRVKDVIRQKKYEQTAATGFELTTSRNYAGA